MRKHAPHFLTLIAVAYAVGCASPGPPAETAPRERLERVPETSPNFQPPELDVGLVSNAHGDSVSTTVLSVDFEPGATQPQRQSAIDLVGGTVIGGMNRGGYGWYYVQVSGDGTIETIYEIAQTLDALPQVILASPYIRFKVGPQPFMQNGSGSAWAAVEHGTHHIRRTFPVSFASHSPPTWP